MPQGLAAMRGMKAEGGWGVVCTEETEIHHTGDLSPYFEGRIWNEHHVVTVGTGAVVMGDIVARQITVRGEVEGTLMATGRVEILNEGRVVGRVLSKAFRLAEGGLFHGRAEPQHLEAALKVARHRRTEATAGGDAAEPSA